MLIRDATPADAAAIAAIYNDAVLHTTATWHTTTVDADERRAWIAARQTAGFPVLVAADDGDVIGYATYGDWRAWEGYRFTVEHSVYVRADRRSRGLGRTLLERLIAHARAAGKHVMVAGIGSENAGSIALHERLGFTEVGRMPQVGAKFGRWLDLVFLQLVLDDRAEPGD
ncbi:N-acetyltransferase family protein [Microbacterium protaetiae]|uniref:N-acetyltransferase family protein n=1 Tax=Microbacterium protaetiae TaxID=2509458 RepID=A0A4V0YD63_9MICO|nr:GNAT family N-acetyltransferase [Microbacterium protaetiae]QAY59611.1 N-acetyltransferase family protein [Microbacterium protaetiae]